MADQQITRLVALGASNLTRGFHPFVALACGTWGPRVEFFTALGHGRSYGSVSRVLARELPGILDCGIWKALESMPEAVTRGIVMDVGNDILYGFSADQTAAWVDEAIRRLKRFTCDIVLTDLPMDGIRRLSPSKFLLFRSILVPSCRLSRDEVLARAERLSARLATVASAHGIEYLQPDPAWFGVDPVHIRRSAFPSAWQHVLGILTDIPAPPRSVIEGMQLYRLRPERRRLFGVEQITLQVGITLPDGGRLWLY